MTGKKPPNIHGIIGICVLAVAQVMVFRRVDPFLSWFYSLAWWSYILIVDSVIYRLKGNSLILSRTREFFLMVCWSFTLWLFFEMVNLVMKDWYYINVPGSRLVRLLGYAFSYGTVLPGIFETTELVESLGLFRNASVPRFRMTPGWSIAILATGGLFLVLPLLIPRYTFPLIWGSFVFLLEPINYHFRGKSLLADWEAGSLRKFYLLLLSGLICGFLWEFWNFWARTKWVYTVPFFDELKLFEMPLLGFLGFPPFAVECYVIYNFISLFRHKRGWEQDSYMVNREKKVSRGLKLATACGIFLFYLLSTQAIDRYTVRSTLATVEDFPGLTKEEREQLEGAGIHTADELVHRACSPDYYGRGSMRLGLSPDRLAELVGKARLIELKGLGVENFLLLEKVGVDSVESLARQDPDELYEMLLRAGRQESAARSPSRAEVKIWILAARSRSGR
ncbi:MAG: DUF4332 domain-containing protein [Deltaproteobacteria bacterium]|nr:DUF4332 domain-containing protein [Deltaproteobacteria bacterium]